MKLQHRSGPSRHPSSLGWARDPQGTPERSESTYNPLPYAVRIAVAASNVPVKVLSRAECLSQLERTSSIHDPILTANLAVVRQAAARHQPAAPDATANSLARSEVARSKGGRR